MSDAAHVPDGYQLVEGKLYMINGEGGLTPAGIVKPEHKLEDEVVRRIVAGAKPLAAQISAFRAQSLDQVDDFVSLLMQLYEIPRGGKKGNLTLYSFDKLQKVIVQVPDLLDFGPELQVAKAIIDELLTGWSADSPDQLKAIVNNAFDVDKQGQINRSALFGLLRHNIEDERWKRAMQALRDSIRIVGSKRYIRMYARPSIEAGWSVISLDMAAD